MAASTSGRPRILRVLEVLSCIYVLLTVLGVLVVLARILLSEAAVTVQLPVQTYWPLPVPGIEITSPPPAEITGGGFRQGEFDVVGLSLATRLWLAAGALAHAAVGVLLGIAVLRICRGGTTTSFPLRLAGSLRMAGITVLVGGVVWQVLSGIGQAQAARETLFVSGFTMVHADADAAADPDRTPSNAGLPLPGVMPSVEFTPALIGLALLGTSAAVVHHGRRDEPVPPSP